MQDPISELKTILKGTVLTDDASLEHYSKDGSIFKVRPSAVVLPSGNQDIISLVKWVKAKKEKDPKNPLFSITCRGKATDQAGGAINEGIILRFPGYLDKILEIGPNFVKVEPGAIVGKINEELAKEGRFLPFYPASQAFSTIGGAISNNASGEKTLKYGSARHYIKSLKMVLSDGAEVLVTPLSFADLKLKKQQFNFEGDIYRNISEIIHNHRKLLEQTRPKVTKYSTGYNLWEVEREVDGEKVFDLTQLIAGSQGTLGIITEITLWTIPKPKFSGLLLAFFDSFIKSGKATQILLEFEPSALEMVDHFLLEFIQKQKPEILSEIISDKIPEIVLLCEFDADEIEEIEDKLNKAKNSISDLSFKIFSTMDSAEQARFWAMRRSALVVIEESSKDKKALPFIEDVVVPSEKFPEYVSSLYEILKKYNVEFAVWGHAGDGNIHVQPFLDLGEPNDREKIFNIADEVFNVVVKLGGVFSGEHNDGIMRTPYLSKLYPAELLEVWKEVKRIFDPLGIFNPGKKIGCNLDYAKAHLREEYEVGPAKPKSSKSA